MSAAALSAAMTTLDIRKEEEKETHTRIKRERRTVEQIYRSLGFKNDKNCMCIAIFLWSVCIQIAFEGCDLYSRLQKGLMKEGLALFGDNAYLNSSFLTTPYPNVRSRSCDDYNYYHSQVSAIVFSV